MSTLLKVENLKMHYITKKQKVHAVEDVSFTVEEGETFALVGESGCGKSATCKSIARLLPESAQILNGSIYFRDQDVVKLKEKEMTSIRGSGIGMIFQEPMSALNPVLTVEYQIFEALRGQGLSKSQKKERAVQLLQLVDIPEPETRLKQYIHQFSGGMRQRAMIAIMLAARPKLLIADEPTTALDVTIQHQIIRLLQRLNRDFQMSILLVTHDLGLVRMMCQRVAVMYAGYIVETAPTDRLFDYPAHPYTFGLLKSIPREKDTRERLEPIEGAPPDQRKAFPGCPFAPRCPRVQDICLSILPELSDVETDHQVRCHFPQERGKYE